MAKKMKKSGVEWIGEIPENWETLKLKYISTFQQNKYCSNDGNLNYVALENIESWNGKYVETKSIYDKEQALICEKGDIIFGKLRPYLAKVHISDKRQCCSGEFVVIRIIPPQRNKFFWYQFISHGFIFMIDRSTYGTKMPRANVDFIRNVSIILPPLDEQQKIVAFLDSQCACLDSALEKTRATIDEYKKLKQAVITQAVTRGIRGARPMKDSGIEWIGEIPKDWGFIKVSRVSTIVRGASPRPAGDPRFFYGNYLPWITVAEVTNAVGKFIESTATFLTKEGAKRSRIIEAGTLLLSNSGATLGVPKINKIKGCINDGSVAFYNLQVDQNFLLYVFASYTNELRKRQQGYGQPNLNTELIKSLYIPNPPRIEQVEIASYLDDKCAMIDALIAKKEQYLIELENYKKSLIYETTTGKREVE